MRSIETKFVGPTNTKPARVKVKACSYNAQVLDWDPLWKDLYQIFKHRVPGMGESEILIPNSYGDYMSYNEIIESGMETYFSHYVAAVAFCDFHAWKFKELRGGENAAGNGYNFIIIPE